MNTAEIVDIMKLHASAIIMTLVVVGTLLGMRYIPRWNRQKKVFLCWRLCNKIYDITEPSKDVMCLKYYNQIVCLMKKHNITPMDFGIGDMQSLKREAITVFKQEITAQGIILQERVADAQRLMKDITIMEAKMLQDEIVLLQETLGLMKNELREFLAMDRSDQRSKPSDHLVPAPQY